MLNINKFPKFEKNGLIHEVVVKNNSGIDRSKIIYFLKYKPGLEFERVSNCGVKVMSKIEFRESKAKCDKFYQTERYKKSSEYKALKKLEELYNKCLTSV